MSASRSSSSSLRVFVVDDSRTARLVLRHALEAEGDIYVVGEAESGKEALAKIPGLAPDLVLMDIYLREGSGLDVAASLMASCPCPILAVTGADPSLPALVFQAMEVGVLDVCAKLPGAMSADYEPARRRLVRLVRSLAGVPVVRRHPRRARAVERSDPGAVPLFAAAPVRMLVIGASTGGPPIIRDLLLDLPRPFPIPIAVVQHMTRGFGRSFARWLAAESGLPVAVVTEPTTAIAGRVYLAPDDRHLELAGLGQLIPTDGPALGFQKPSIDVFFRTVAASLGSRAVAVLLTGMGCDGANGLLALRRSGSATLVQAPETCAVDGMPTAAIQLGAAGDVVAPGQLVQAVSRYVRA